jgi:hypothetical protein
VAFGAFLTFLAAFAGFAAVSFGAFLAGGSGCARSALRSGFAANALRAFFTFLAAFAGFAAVSFGAFLAFLATLARGARRAGSALRSGFTPGACFALGSSRTDESLETLRALRADWACDSGYARDALEALSTGGSVVAGGSLRSRRALGTRFSPQLLEHLRADLVNAPDGVAVVPCRGCRADGPKDHEGTGSDEGGYALHSLALFYGPWGVGFWASHAWNAEREPLLGLPPSGVFFG